MEKRFVFGAMSWVLAALLVGVVIFVRNYARYEKQKNWEEATEELTPEQLTSMGAERKLKDTKAMKSERRRWGIYAATGVAIVAYLSFAI